MKLALAQNLITFFTQVIRGWEGIWEISGTSLNRGKMFTYPRVRRKKSSYFLSLCNLKKKGYFQILPRVVACPSLVHLIRGTWLCEFGLSVHR